MMVLAFPRFIERDGNLDSRFSFAEKRGNASIIYCIYDGVTL